MPDMSADGFNADNSREILIIDIENYPSHIVNLKADENRYRLVMICYSQNETKINLNVSRMLNSMYAANKLEYFEVPGKRKNAADFGISFLAGKISQQFSKEHKIIIASNDTDLDTVVDILKDSGYESERMESPNSKRSNGTNIVEVSLLEETKSFCAYLSNAKNRRGRPSREQALINSIKSQLSKSTANPELVFQELIKHKLIKIENLKIVYDDEKLSSVVDA